MFDGLDQSEIKRPLRVNSVIGIDGSLLVLAKHYFLLAMVLSCETQGGWNHARHRRVDEARYSDSTTVILYTVARLPWD